MTEPLHLSRHGHVLQIILDRPKANAIDVATSRALYQAFRTFQDDDDMRVAILTGGGERFFSAGWDLKAQEAVDADHGPGGFAGITEFWDLDKPVIAAVNGLAFGGGFELALACDLIIAVEDAEFALPEVTLGIVAESGGVQRLPRRLPRALANELLFTGRRMSALEAKTYGLLNQIVPRDRLLAAAHTLAASIAAHAPLALRATKALLRLGEGKSIADSYAAMRAGAVPIYDAMLRSDDAHEGPRAFGEKRPPDWKGR